MDVQLYCEHLLQLICNQLESQKSVKSKIEINPNRINTKQPLTHSLTHLLTLSLPLTYHTFTVFALRIGPPTIYLQSNLITSIPIGKVLLWTQQVGELPESHGRGGHEVVREQ